MTSPDTPYEFTEVRRLRAPPAAVYRAWTEPDLVARWYRCGPGFTFDILRWEAVPGGSIEVDITELTTEAMVTVTVTGRFLEVEPDVRLVYLWGAETIDVRFLPHEGGTEVRVHHKGSGPPEKLDVLHGGWSHSLGKLITFCDGALAPAGDTTMDMKTLVHDYFDCWRRGDRDGARALLADDVVFRSPGVACNDAESFLAACWGHHAAMGTIEWVHEIYDPPRAYVAYRASTFTSGEVLTVRDGKIAGILVTPSPTWE